MLPVNAYAERVKTNIEGVVIKNVKCVQADNSLYFVVSNKSASQIDANLIVTVFDNEGDPVDNKEQTIFLKPVSGSKYRANSLTCSDQHTYAFRFE